MSGRSVRILMPLAVATAVLISNPAHSQWDSYERMTAQSLRAALASADLTRVNAAADMRNQSMGLMNTRIVNAKAVGADFSNSDFSRADFSFSDLSGARMHRTQLVRADLSGTTLAGADLTEAN